MLWLPRVMIPDKEARLDQGGDAYGYGGKGEGKDEAVRMR